jgi:hypothetical protein
MHESQTKRIYKHLKSGNSLTQLSALRLFGCLRLSERIRDIDKQIDNKFYIDKKWVIVGYKNGKKRVVEYRIKNRKGKK